MTDSIPPVLDPQRADEAMRLCWRTEEERLDDDLYLLEVHHATRSQVARNVVLDVMAREARAT